MPVKPTRSHATHTTTSPRSSDIRLSIVVYSVSSKRATRKQPFLQKHSPCTPRSTPQSRQPIQAHPGLCSARRRRVAWQRSRPVTDASARAIEQNSISRCALELHAEFVASDFAFQMSVQVTHYPLLQCETRHEVDRAATVAGQAATEPRSCTSHTQWHGCMKP